jgi:hypothetical protein
MNRSGVSAERRILAYVGMAAFCRAAATSRFMESVADLSAVALAKEEARVRVVLGSSTRE